MKKATRPEEQSRLLQGQSITVSINPDALVEQAPTKIARILAYMLVSCNSLNRFEAEALGDHCLHSTVADLTHLYGLEFQRQDEKVPTRFGSSADVTRYSLPESQHERARAVLARMIVGHAGASDTPTEVVVFACFLTLATILQTQGLSRDVLVRAIDAARLQPHEIHDEPEGLQ